MSNEVTKLIKQDRTEEVAEIIERMPTSFGVWVGSIVALLAILLIVFGWIIKYPDVLHGQVTINTRQAPVKLVAITTGSLDLLQRNSGDHVKKGDYMAVIKNPAATNSVFYLDSLLRGVDIRSLSYNKHRHFFPDSLSLGELSPKYFAFLNAAYEYLDYHKETPFETQKDILHKLSATQSQTLKQFNADYDRLKNKYSIALNFYLREELLFNEKVIPAAELEKAHLSLITSEQEFKAVDRQITENKYQINDADNKIEQLVFQRMEKERELEIGLYNSFFELQENINLWKKRYVFEAPISGKMVFLNFWKDDDYIQANQDMFTVLPDENELFGQVLLPEQGAGKVKEGEEVVIKLDNYPYAQFGSVKGKVSSISAVANQQLLSNAQNKVNAYLVTITLPAGLKTNYGTTLLFRSESKGSAEIITDERRLIERLFDNLRHSIH